MFYDQTRAFNKDSKKMSFSIAEKMFLFKKTVKFSNNRSDPESFTLLLINPAIKIVVFFLSSGFYKLVFRKKFVSCSKRDCLI